MNGKRKRQHYNLPTLQHANQTKKLQLANPTTCQPNQKATTCQTYNLPTLQLANPTTCQLYNLPTLQLANQTKIYNLPTCP